MEQLPVIKVNNVKKSYRIYQDKANTLKERVVNFNRVHYETKEVLKGVSFEVLKGRSVGIIGENGCGKSTTLKLLTKIIYPDEGNIEINGRVSSLLELGAGFHPDMSGRDNIYTNSSIFGLSHAEIDRRINDIIAFSELEEYIDNPVRTYSSGMYMRLAFSVAINVDADILLIDEILAVGDVNFQKKCLDKISEIKEKGTTVVIVSHSLSQIEDICDDVVWLEDGVVKEVGEAEVVVDHYKDFMEELRIKKIRKLKEKTTYDENDISFNKLTIRSGNQKILFTDIKIYDENDRACVSNVIASISIAKKDGTLCYATNSVSEKKKSIRVNDEGVISVSILKLPLLSGEYMVNIAMTSEDGEVYDDLQRAIFFEISSDSSEQGVCKLNCDWNI